MQVCPWKRGRQLMQKRRDDYKRKKMQREFNETVTAPLNIVEHQSVILGNHQNLIVLPYVQCSMVLVNSKKVGSVGTPCLHLVL